MIRWTAYRGVVRSLAYSPCGRWLAGAVGAAKHVWLWESTTGRLVRKFTGADGKLRQVAFTPDGRHVAAKVVWDDLFYFWDTATGELVARLECDLGTSVFAFSPDGKTLVWGGVCMIDWWDVPSRPTGADVRRPDRELRNDRLGGGTVVALAFSPDGRLLAVNFNNGFVLWDAAKHRAVKREMREPTVGGGPVAFAPDGRRVAVGVAQTLELWPLGRGKPRMVTLPPRRMKPNGMGSLAFSPDGARLMAACWDGRVRVWDAATLAEVRTLDFKHGTAYTAVFAPDGLTAAVGGEKGQVVVWDVDS
jgi:WD40 repeat protein